MSIDTFIQEIETRKKNDLAELDKKLNDKKSETDAKKNSQVKELKEKYTNEAKTKAGREGARIVEAGKLEAKKILFDAINKNLDFLNDSHTWRSIVHDITLVWYNTLTNNNSINCK